MAITVIVIVPDWDNLKMLKHDCWLAHWKSKVLKVEL